MIILSKILRLSMILLKIKIVYNSLKILTIWILIAERTIKNFATKFKTISSVDCISTLNI